MSAGGEAYTAVPECNIVLELKLYVVYSTQVFYNERCRCMGRLCGSNFARRPVPIAPNVDSSSHRCLKKAYTVVCLTASVVDGVQR